MKLTSAQQRNAVSEGFALGLVICGHPHIPNDRFSVGLAFENAWQDWPHKQPFSQVSTDLRNGSAPLIVATRATESKHVWRLYWEETGPEYVVRSRDGSTGIDPVDVARSISGGLSADAWADLARRFLAELGTD